MWIFIGICAYLMLFIGWCRHELKKAPTDKELWGEDLD